jgi:hypothetical protein
MLNVILALLPKIPAVVASLPEFLALIEHAKTTMTTSDQATLQAAYVLAKSDSDAAHDELAALVAAHAA